MRKATPMKPAAELTRMLAANILPLVQEVLPAGKRGGAEWRVGSIHNETGRSLGVHLCGPKTGVWSDFSTGEAGDALDLVAAALFRGNLRNAMRWATNWLGLSADTTPRRPTVLPSVAVSDTSAATEQATEDRTKRLDYARCIWSETTGLTGSLAEVYLGHRKLQAPDGDVIRFHSRCPRKTEAGTERLPAMVAKMVDPLTGAFVGVHRTFLLPDGSGKVPYKPKMMLGGAGVIHLSADEDVTTGLGITEGIENGLSIIQVAGWSPVWACGSAASIAKLPVLDGIECLTIFADADQPGMVAARECATRWIAANREVQIIPPRRGGDWNDVVRGLAA
jgi:hypothetical protein